MYISIICDGLNASGVFSFAVSRTTILYLQQHFYQRRKHFAPAKKSKKRLML